MRYWLNFDSTRVTLHRDLDSCIRDFPNHQKSDKNAGWEWFDSKEAAIAAVAPRKIHECCNCDP